MKGRTALITGASRGIGAAIAEVFAREGARLVTPPRSELDLSRPESIDRYVGSLPAPIDILVNNAGINRLAALAELTPGELREVLEVNLVAPLELARGVAPGMKSRGYGRIVNVSSIWGSITRRRRLGYTASKSGLNGLTRALALELAPHGVLVNAVAPGYVDTELTRRNNSPPEIAAIVASIPLGRLAEPREIAEVVAFLCSSRNTYITGQVIVADGGILCT